MDARISSVEERILGSSLVADTSIGAGTITVSDGTEFDDTGTLQLGAEIMAYTAVDETTGIITLTGTLASTHTADDPVYVYPLSQERVAYLVAGDDPKDEEGMAARIPHALWDKIPVGIRDWAAGEGETVQADFIGDELVIMELTGQDPVIDGAFINPTTLPANPPDGIPPTSSPAPTLDTGIGVLYAKWTPIANHDPVTYDVHVSTTTGFTPSGTTPGSGTCYANVEGGICTIRTDPATAAPLVYDTVYYVKIVARDVDGSATASSQASATPIKADSPDIAVGAVRAEQIFSGAVTTSALESELVLATTLKTAASGRRVEISPAGATLFEQDESTLVDLPTDPNKAATFSGQLDAAALSVGPGAATITGSDGLQIEPDSQLHMVGGQSNPSLAPVLSGTHPPITFGSALGGTMVGVRVSHYTASGGSGGATACYYGTVDTLDGSGYNCYAVEWQASNGAVLRTNTIITGTNPSGSGHRTGLGAVRIGTHIYALFHRQDTGQFVIRTIASATFATEATTNIGASSSTLDPDNIKNAAFGTDGTNPFVFSTDSGAGYRPNRASVNITTPTSPSLGTATAFSAGAFKFNNYGHADNFGSDWGPLVVTGGAWDGSANWYLTFRWTHNGTGEGLMLQQYVQATGAVVAKKEIHIPDTLYGRGYSGGMAYDGTDYHVFSSTSSPLIKRQIKTAYTWDYTLGSILYVGYTWDDGTHHTSVSPVSQLSMDSGISQAPEMGMTVTVTMPTIPALVTKNLLYVLFASSTPAASTLKLQAATTYASTDSSPTVTHKQYNASGAVNPDTNGNTFPAGGAPSFIKGDATDATASWEFDSSGKFVLPRYTVAQRPGSPVRAQVLYDEDAQTPSFYGQSAAGLWAPVASRMAIAPRTFETFTDLLGSYNDTNANDNAQDWVVFGNNGGSAVSLASVAKHPGLLQLATGTTSNATGNAGIRTLTTALNLGDGIVRYSCLLRTPSAITTPFVYITAGLADLSTSDPTNGFYFRWNNNVNSNKWQRAIAATFTDTGFTAVVAATWYRLDIVVNAAATSADFYINGTSVGTSSGSAQSGVALQAFAATRKDTSSVTSRATWVDYIGVAGEFSADRL